MSEPTKTDERRKVALDVGIGSLFLSMGWMSFFYPFGRDQGLYYYVAREWVVRGAIPYRDVFDHKTPGIYVLYALGIRIFGQHLWGIRVFDMLAVLLVGLVSAALAVRRGERIPHGLRALGILFASTFFFGFLNYWDTAQSEIYYALLGMASVWAVRRIEDERRACAACGAFAAAAMIMKPTSMWFVFVALFELVRRTREHAEWRKHIRQTGLFFAIGGLVVVVPMFAYFGAHGALGQMYTIAIKANSYYASHENSIDNGFSIPLRIWDYFFFYNPFSAVMLIGMVAAFRVARVSGDQDLRERHRLALLLVLAALFATVMQLKFYLLHWSVMIGPMVLVCLNLSRDLAFVLPRLGLRRSFIASGCLFVFLYVSTEWRTREWWGRNEVVWEHLRGHTSREEYSRAFDIPGFFSYHDSEEVGLWLKDHSGPDDTVAVRAFEPQIYATADRRYTGRFFWTTFFTSPVREKAETRAKWQNEDAANLRNKPPRYAVTLNFVPEGPDSTKYFQPLGYVTRFKNGSFDVLEREAP